MTTSSGATLPIATGRETARELWAATRGRRRPLAAVVVLGLASASLALVTPLALGRLIDLVRSGEAGTGTVVETVVALVVASIVSAIGTAVTTVVASRVYQSVLADLRERMVGTAFSLPQHAVEQAGIGDLIARGSDDVSQVADAAPQVVPAFSTALFMVIVTFAGMTALDWRYALALAVVLPVHVVTVRWYLSAAPRIYRAERAAMGDRAQQMLESLRGAGTVRGLGLGEQRHRQVVDTSWSVVGHSLRARTAQNMLAGRLNAAEFLGTACLLVAGYLLVSAGQSTVGAATAAVLFYYRLFGPINQLLFVVDTLQSALASLSRIVGVLLTPAVAAPVEIVAPPAAVTLTGIEFAYPGAPRAALQYVDLRIDAGQHVAVVGASGAGKTTLANVVAGIQTARSGVVARPRRTAMVTQDTHVFAGTLRSNLTLATPPDAPADDAALSAALDAVGARTLLDRLPDGLDTVLGGAGTQLTTAQAQQVALARVVLADPDLAIFDEATAEAGSSDAGVLDRAAEAALRGRTALVVAHRLSQAAVCDRIVVMDDGRVVEEGAHAELIARDGRYASLWNAWTRARTEQP